MTKVIFCMFGAYSSHGLQFSINKGLWATFSIDMPNKSLSLEDCGMLKNRALKHRAGCSPLAPQRRVMLWHD